MNADPFHGRDDSIANLPRRGRFARFDGRAWTAQQRRIALGDGDHRTSEHDAREGFANAGESIVSAFPEFFREFFAEGALGGRQRILSFRGAIACAV